LHPQIRRALGGVPPSDVTRLALQPLSPAAVARLAAGSGQSADEVHRITGGNAFYVAELLRGGMTEGLRSVQDALLEAGRAVQVAGSPVDQFSFAEDASAGVLRVLLREIGDGEGMWAGEVSGGNVALASIPFGSFGAGNAPLPRAGYRDLPEPEGWRFHNRFVGDYVLYAAGLYGDEDETATVYAVPLDGRAVQQITRGHGVTRFDRMGRDAIAIGPASPGVAPTITPVTSPAATSALAA
jgi:hypothetical protein